MIPVVEICLNYITVCFIHEIYTRRGVLISPDYNPSKYKVIRQAGMSNIHDFSESIPMYRLPPPTSMHAGICQNLLFLDLKIQQKV
jgi:hypothetical protein